MPREGAAERGRVPQELCRPPQGARPVVPVRPSRWRSGGRSVAPKPAWPSPRPPQPRARCPPARARPSRCRCPHCPRRGRAPDSSGPPRSGCVRGSRGRRGGPRCSTASSPMSPTSARWKGGCSASSATSTRESCKPSARSAPSSSWSTCVRCRRSWRGCTSASTSAWRSSPRSRRRWRPTGTWTSCWHTWRSSAAPSRSCTWPRAPTPRTPPDPACPPHAAILARPRPGGGGEGGVGWRGPAHRAARRVASSGGARAMAAGRELREELEGRRLLRAVTRLQACVRGFLLRKRFRSVRAEYEEVVREIEGDLSRLRWRGQFLPRPVFLPEEPAHGTHSAPLEAAPRDGASTEKPPEEPDASEPEQDSGCSGIKAPAQPQSGNGLSCAGGGAAVSPPPLGAGADKCADEGHGASEEAWQDNSSVSSVWDSELLEAESHGDCQEILFEDMEELPRTRAGLQAYRKHLVMELLWLQQAIASRENYLMLKQQLAAPDP
ncbi:translation initiation factor IF-2 isoform X2 [Cuculus canorus]|uniref:translation initiation factor IF-2 isoform X2 n=1 Tax=Cuculus canorus TaxID=55661 RepID=UPI0023AACC1B|nr:translation initiation factor IF-2 isoform X2 [Cuculus canorus]